MTMKVAMSKSAEPTHSVNYNSLLLFCPEGNCSLRSIALDSDLDKRQNLSMSTSVELMCFCMPATLFQLKSENRLRSRGVIKHLNHRSKPDYELDR